MNLISGMTSGSDIVNLVNTSANTNSTFTMQDNPDVYALRLQAPAANGNYTMRLARSGRQWKGCCPFHGEKTPSFYVYDDHFHCFGCGAHGSAIGFLMEHAGLSYPDAIEELAKSVGQPLDYYSEADPFAKRLDKDVEDKSRLLRALGELK